MRDKIIEILKECSMEIWSNVEYSGKLKNCTSESIADEILELFVKSPHHVSLCARCKLQIHECACAINAMKEKYTIGSIGDEPV